LLRRIWEHREGAVPGFTSKYDVKSPVWFERHDDIESAILREKAIKKWQRAWKLALIEETNPNWQDLYEKLTGSPLSRG
jgi:putative endonuclease